MPNSCVRIHMTVVFVFKGMGLNEIILEIGIKGEEAWTLESQVEKKSAKEIIKFVSK